METAEQLDYLVRIGCEHYQGYYCSRPLPAGEFLSFLRKQRLRVVEN